jgi:hypothetical protein
MLRIEKECDGCVTKLRLSGRIQSDQIATIQSEISKDGTRKVLDLSEITLVDIDAVRFLITCEDEGIELSKCPSYICEWMVRERSAGM